MTLPGANRLLDKGLTHLILVLSKQSKMLPGAKPSLGKRFHCACRRALSCLPAFPNVRSLGTTHRQLTFEICDIILPQRERYATYSIMIVNQKILLILFCIGAAFLSSCGNSENRAIKKRVVFASKNLKRDQIITAEDLEVKETELDRPDTIDQSLLKLLVGRRVRCDIETDVPLFHWVIAPSLVKETKPDRLPKENEQSAPAVIARKEIPEGSIIEDSALSFQLVRAGSIPAKSISSKSLAIGKKARYRIYKDEFVNAFDLDPYPPGTPVRVPNTTE